LLSEKTLSKKKQKTLETTKVNSENISNNAEDENQTSRCSILSKKLPCPKREKLGGN
jgi:hypothetical protein